MVEDAQKVRADWQSRQQEHGKSPKAVLMKGLHPRLNESIDLWHRDVLDRLLHALEGVGPGALVLDVGCGFGRLAGEVSQAGHIPIGMDFTQGFCADFAATHGSAVCADQAHLPFLAGSFQAFYSVTSLMYLDVGKARHALAELDRCTMPGGMVLLLEPCQEFNSLARRLMPGKGSGRLTMPGFSLDEMRSMLPDGWVQIAAGHCRWLTFLLPVLALAARWELLYRPIARLARILDQPRLNGRSLRGRYSLYRWVICRKTG